MYFFDKQVTVSKRSLLSTFCYWLNLLALFPFVSKFSKKDIFLTLTNWKPLVLV